MSLRRDEELKRELSELYFQTVCNKAGYESGILPRDSDLDGRDAYIFIRDDFGPDVLVSSFTMWLQIKSTSQDLIGEKSKFFSYVIDIKNYNKYRDPKSNEAMFVLVYVIPSTILKSSWVCVGAKQLAMKGRMYWASLYNAEPRLGNEDVSVRFYLKDVFDAKWLLEYARQFAKHQKRVPYAGLQKQLAK